MLPFIVIGITTGSVYGLAGTGLVLTYKTSGIFNFAYGSLARSRRLRLLLPPYGTRHGLAPGRAALPVRVGPARRPGARAAVARILETVSATLKVVATVGLLSGRSRARRTLVRQHFSQLPAPSSRRQHHRVRRGERAVGSRSSSSSSRCSPRRVLYYFFRYVRLGVAMRGVVDNPDLVSMTGEIPVRVRRWAWIIGTVFASMAGLLLAPASASTPWSSPCWSCRPSGRRPSATSPTFRSTFAGGWPSGFLGSLHEVRRLGQLAQRAAGRPALHRPLHRPRGHAAGPSWPSAVSSLALPVHKPWDAPHPGAPGARHLGARSSSSASCPDIAGPTSPSGRTSWWTSILFLSLGLLVRTAGQISLCQYAFAADRRCQPSAISPGSYHIPWLARHCCWPLCSPSRWER